MGEKIAGIEIPDTRLAAEATALVREAEPCCYSTILAGSTCSGCCKGYSAA